MSQGTLGRGTVAALALAAMRRDEPGGLDAVRRAQVAEIARALKCQVIDGERVAPPMDVLRISPACLTPRRALALRDPATGAAYAISFPSAASPGSAPPSTARARPAVPRLARSTAAAA
jgi:hypothetical protein